jgi:hypothetical protein
MFTFHVSASRITADVLRLAVCRRRRRRLLRSRLSYRGLLVGSRSPPRTLGPRPNMEPLPQPIRQPCAAAAPLRELPLFGFLVWVLLHDGAVLAEVVYGFVDGGVAQSVQVEEAG